MNYRAVVIFLLPLLLIWIGGCQREFEKPTADPSFQPSFSADTLRVDTLYSRISSATKRLVVYNRHHKPIEIEDITLVGDPIKQFRINVDGRSGRDISNIMIPPQDSIYLLVEATFPKGESDLPTRIEASIQFYCKGQVSSVLLEGFRLNTDHCTTLIVSKDSIIGGRRPLLIRDSLVVAQGSTLTLSAGSHLLMGDKGRIVVYGTLLAEGSKESPILIEGIRRDNLIPKVNYRLLPGQWESIFFRKGSYGNKLCYTTIRNGRGGICVGEEDTDHASDLSLESCAVGNMKVNALRGENADIVAINSLFSNTMASAIELRGGKSRFYYCTIVGFYPFDRRIGSCLSVGEPKRKKTPSVRLSHSVIEGSFNVFRVPSKPPLGGEISLDPKHSEWVEIESCYLRSPLENFAKVKNSLEAQLPADSIFVSLGKDRKSKEYHFKYDFRPFSSAPFAGQGGEDLSIAPPPKYDLYGVKRRKKSTWGALESIDKKEIDSEITHDERDKNH